MERRLAAILAADVVGYSRLMETDEAGVLAALKDRRRTILEPLLAHHHGRVVKLMGDGVLIEFASAVRAIECAVDLQKRMSEANAGLPDDRCVVLRVGVNLGDVMVEGSDLYGDGVNVATRLEGLCEPGEITLSGSIHEQVSKKLPLPYEDLGPQKLKNIVAPVQVYRIRVEGGGPMRIGGPPASTKPSIAVLAFANLSGNSGQEYFAEGITEDIITLLSRFRSLFVIARSSSFHYKGQSPKIQDIGRELGVEYVIEGGVRRAGTRVRITAQLVEADTGNHIWADRYDREVEDIFAVQDEVAQAIVTTLAGHLEDASRRRALRKSASNLSAYDLVLRGRYTLGKGSKRDVIEARKLFMRALELEPDYARAYVELAETYFYEAISNWTTSRDAAAEHLFELARKAAQLDDQDSRVHLCLAWAYWRVRSNFDMAEAQIEEAIMLNPNDKDNYCLKALLCTCAGNLEEAISCAGDAICRAPNLPEECLYSRVIAEYLLGRFEQAIMTFGRMLHPSADLYGWIAASYAQLGREADARAMAMKFRERARDELVTLPDSDVEGWRSYWRNKFRSRSPAVLDRLFDGLRKAGLSA